LDLSGIDADRVQQVPVDLSRIVVGVDPAVSSGDDACLTGIVVCGMGSSPEGKLDPPHFYVIEDLSLNASPDAWAQAVTGAYVTHKGDRIVAEVNNGGDLVEAILRTKRLEFAYQAVHATRGKIRRAEPIAALYEQHRVHHVAHSARSKTRCATTLRSPRRKARIPRTAWTLWCGRCGRSQSRKKSRPS